MKEVVEILKSGGTILYPTDTIWGLGCDATNEEACQKILDIKKRTSNKSFVILVDDFPMLQRYIPEFQEVCYNLADLAIKPLTIIYPKAKGLAPSILAEDRSVGIRITKDPICIKIIRGLRKPIVSTSANLSGEKNPVNYDNISSKIKNDVNHIVKERLTEKMNTPSQIIKIGINGEIEIIRK